MTADPRSPDACVIGVDFGTLSAGACPDVAAAAAMGGHRPVVHTPDPASADVYDDLYAEYVTLHDHFGRGASDVLHRLRAVRDRAVRERVGGDRAGRARAEGGRS
jgi:ribulose kinase